MGIIGQPNNAGQMQEGLIQDEAPRFRTGFLVLRPSSPPLPIRRDVGGVLAFVRDDDVFSAPATYLFTVVLVSWRELLDLDVSLCP